MFKFSFPLLDGRLLCDNGVQLLLEEYVCDVMFDCHDNSDEDECVGKLVKQNPLMKVE